MALPAYPWRCIECGNPETVWRQRCPGCGALATLHPPGVKEALARPAAPALAPGAAETPEFSIADAKPEPVLYVPTGFRCVDKVLGGGFARGNTTILGGNAGAGKSRFLTQFFAQLPDDEVALYVSGEESYQQLTNKFHKLGAGGRTNIFALAESCCEVVEEAIERRRPTIVVIDSVQKFWSRHFPGKNPNGPVQMRYVLNTFLARLKGRGICVIAISQVNNDGEVGSSGTRHDGDVLCYLTNKKKSQTRWFSSPKNREGDSGARARLFMHPRGTKKEGTLEEIGYYAPHLPVMIRAKELGTDAEAPSPAQARRAAKKGIRKARRGAPTKKRAAPPAAPPARAKKKKKGAASSTTTSKSKVAAKKRGKAKRKAA